ncbi:MAG: copper chaperone PCu(A)C [Gammaproteobacteria bacterium]|nr:copper chaperone PCu(A)C [Gammaproteobacteria bacterium]
MVHQTEKRLQNVISHRLAVPLFMVCASLLSLHTFAQQHILGDIVIDQPRARPTPPGVSTGAGYMTVTNNGDIADKLLATVSEIAERVEIHTHTMDEDVIKMRRVENLEIRAHGSVSLSPGGLHLMLIGLQQQLIVGQHFTVDLVFERAGPTTIEVVVKEVDANM